MNIPLILILVTWILGSNQAEFHTLEGLEFRGELKELTDSEQIIIRVGDNLKPININNLYAIYFQHAPAENLGPYPAGLLLQDGSYLAGTVEGGDEETLFLSHHRLGLLEIPIEVMASLLLGAPDLPRDFDRHRASGSDDVLYKKQDGIRGKDYISGTLILFTREGLSFDCSLGELDFSFDDLEALTLAKPENTPALTGRPVRIILRDHSGAIHGSFRGLDSGKMVLDTLFKNRVSIPLDAMDSILIESNRFVALSDLSPVEVKESPYIGDPETFLYPYRKDRSVTGELLSCMGKKFAKGLGLHSRASLTFALEGKYLAFEAFMGLSDEVLKLPAEGSVQYEIMVDGKEIYRSPVIRGGNPCTRMPRIGLKGASTLKVTVDFADGFDSGDRALLGNPILLKAPR